MEVLPRSFLSVVYTLFDLLRVSFRLGLHLALHRVLRPGHELATNWLEGVGQKQVVELDLHFMVHLLPWVPLSEQLKD